MARPNNPLGFCRDSFSWRDLYESCQSSRGRSMRWIEAVWMERGRMDLGCPGEMPKQRFNIRLRQEEGTGLWKEQRVSMDQGCCGLFWFAAARAEPQQRRPEPRFVLVPGLAGGTAGTVLTAPNPGDCPGLGKITRSSSAAAVPKAVRLAPLGCSLIVNDQ